MRDRTYHQPIVDADGVAAPLAVGEGDTVALTGDESTTGWTFRADAGTTKGGSNVSGLTAATDGSDPTTILLTIPASATAAVSPPTTPSLTLGPQPSAPLFVTLWRTDVTPDKVLGRYVIGVYDAEG